VSFKEKITLYKPEIININTCYITRFFEIFVPDSYILTPWNTVFLEKLTVSQLVKKFPAFYGTRRFITAFATARHLSLS